MSAKNIFYAQSGGVTAVINATACGVIEAAKKHPYKFNKVYAGINGILGALNEDLIDTSQESAEAIAALKYTPGAAFGSCRYKLKKIEDNPQEYERFIKVFKAHDIDYFFYNGGNDSSDTINKIANFFHQNNYPISCIGIPKTVDNDLPFTDNCPGFGSVAKYVAISAKEAEFDVESMHATSTKVFIMEVMGRHAGWIASAAGLASGVGENQYLILFPEIPFNEEAFLERVDNCVKKYGYCVVVVSEGVKNKEGKFLSDAGLKDAFGHTQLGGVAPVIAHLVKSHLGLKYHWAVCDYLQRSARHIASKVDLDQAYALGQAAVELAAEGKHSVMPMIVREPGPGYHWHIGEVEIAKVANVEKFVPREFITPDGFGITQACHDYLCPLIQGEGYPPYKNGMPDYTRLKNILVPKKL